MTIYANIGNFTTWFIEQVATIITTITNYLGNIDIVTGVNIMTFIITIILLTAFIKIFITPGRKKNDIK